MPDHQLRVWSEVTGFTSGGRVDGGWRRYSPVDVWRLSIVQRFKERSQISLAANAGLIEFLGQTESYDQSIEAIYLGRYPTLLADLQENFEIAADLRFDKRDLRQRSDFWIVLDVTRPVLISLTATLRGGLEYQKRAAARIVSVAPIFVPKGRGHRKVDTRKDKLGPEEALLLAERALRDL